MPVGCQNKSCVPADFGDCCAGLAPGSKSDDDALSADAGTRTPGSLPRLLSIDWRLLPPFPGGAEDNDGAFIDSRTLVTAFGLSRASYPGSLNSSWALDVDAASPAWRPLPPAGVPPRSMQACAMAAGSLWCFGGLNNNWRAQGGPSRTMKDGCRLTRGANTFGWVWEPAPALPYAVEGHGLAAVGNKLYLVGGQVDEGLVGPGAKLPNVGSKLLVLDTTRPEGGWVELPSLPGTPRCGVSVTAVAGKIYVLGGLTTSDVAPAKRTALVADCWVYDPAIAATGGSGAGWKRLPDMPFPEDIKTSDSTAFMDRFIVTVGGSMRYVSTNGSSYGPAPQGPTIPNGTCGVYRTWGSEYASAIYVYDTHRRIWGEVQSTSSSQPELLGGSTGGGHASCGPFPFNVCLPQVSVSGDRIAVLGGEADPRKVAGTQYLHDAQWVLLGKMAQMASTPTTRLKIDEQQKVHGRAPKADDALDDDALESRRVAHVPSNKNVLCDVRSQGAVGDNQTEDTTIFDTVLQRCAKLMQPVIVRPGTYLVRPLQLFSNTDLVLNPGAILVAWSGVGWQNGWPNSSTAVCEASSYSRPQPVVMPRLESLLWADNVENLTIRGGGMIDGQGWRWWPLRFQNEYWHNCRPIMIEIRGTRNVNVLADNLTLWQSPMYHIAARGLQNAHITRINVSTGTCGYRAAPNTDGLNVGGQEIYVSDTTIQNGDDCIPLGHHAVNMLVERVTCRCGNGVTAVVYNSGSIANLTFRSMMFERTHAAITVRRTSYAHAGFVGVLGDIKFENMLLKDVDTAIDVSMQSLPPVQIGSTVDIAVVSNLTFSNIRGTVGTAGRFSCDRCVGIVMENVRLNSTKAYTCNNAFGTGIGCAPSSGLRTGAGSKSDDSHDILAEPSSSTLVQQMNHTQYNKSQNGCCCSRDRSMRAFNGTCPAAATTCPIRGMRRLGLKTDNTAHDPSTIPSDCCSFSPPMLLGGAVQATLPNGSVTVYHSNESKVDHFHALDGSTIIGQYGDPGYYDGQMPILLSRDAGKSWTSPVTVPCNRLTQHNQSQFQCFSGDSIVLKNSNAGGKLVVRTLGLPSPTGDGEFVSLGTEFTVDAVTGNLTVALLDRKVRFVAPPWKLHAGCWTGPTGFSWSTATSIVQLQSGAILATTAICVNNVTHAHWASQAASLALYRSDDGGFTFRFVSLVADAREYEWSYYGPGSENSIAVLSDGVTLMVVNRFDGNAGCGGIVPPAGDKPLTTTTHYTEYHVQFSSNEGTSWSRAVPLPHMGCARPRLLMLGKGKGPLLLAGGRNCVAQKNATDVALLIWVNSDGMGGFQHRDDSAAMPGQTWRQLSVTAAHNREWRGDPSYRFNNPQDPFASQSYTSLVPVGDGDAMLIYNKYWNYGGAVSHSTGFGMRLSPLKTDDRYSIYYTLGNPAWSPEWSSTKPLPGPPPYNVSQFGLRAQSTITFDISSGNQSPWPRIIGIDRGTDGKPCAGPNAEPCYNYNWAPSCTKAGGVNTETMWGSLCCAAGGCSPQEGNASAVGRLVHSFVQQKVPADFTGNCVLDCEGWNALTTDTTFGTCDSDPDFGIPNL
jgi:polygalacturonase